MNAASRGNDIENWSSRELMAYQFSQIFNSLACRIVTGRRDTVYWILEIVVGLLGAWSRFSSLGVSPCAMADKCLSPQK